MRQLPEHVSPEVAAALAAVAEDVDARRERGVPGVRAAIGAAAIAVIGLAIGTGSAAAVWAPATLVLGVAVALLGSDDERRALAATLREAPGDVVRVECGAGERDGRRRVRLELRDGRQHELMVAPDVAAVLERGFRAPSAPALPRARLLR
jgi:hypothetical protein